MSSEAYFPPVYSCRQDCDPDCPETIQIPGPQGPAGADGEPGSDGENAFTDLVDQFVQPAVNANVLITVANRDWISEGQVIFIEQGGYYEAISQGGGSGEFTVKNLGYTGNAAPAAIVPANAHVSPGGLEGPTGSLPGGSLLAANNLSDVASAPTARTNLGLTSTAVTNLATIMLKADNLSGLASAATSRTNLGVAIGSNVQAFNALLAALAGLSPLASGNIIYTTGSNVVAAAAITSFGRSLIDDSTAAAARTTLGSVFPRYGLLGSLTAVDLNTTNTDNAITLESARYRIDKIVVENASTSLTTCTDAVFTGAGASGTTICAAQALSALTASTKFKDMTLEAVCGTDIFTATTIYFRTTVAQGGAATANVWVFGWSFA